MNSNERMRLARKGLNQKQVIELSIEKGVALSEYMRFCIKWKEVPREEILIAIETVRTPEALHEMIKLITKDRGVEPK